MRLGLTWAHPAIILGKQEEPARPVGTQASWGKDVLQNAAPCQQPHCHPPSAAHHEHDAGVGAEFNSDRQALALLHAQAANARIAHVRVAQAVEVDQLHDLCSRGKLQEGGESGHAGADTLHGWPAPTLRGC